MDRNFETQIHTIRSRQSPKHFGLKKGITNYTGVANHVSFNAPIIGADESESHYVYDILANQCFAFNRSAEPSSDPPWLRSEPEAMPRAA
jgi:hypothetical protein